MSNVNFDQENNTNSYKFQGTNEKQSFVIRFLLKLGIVKNEKSAVYMVLAVVLVGLLVSGYIVFTLFDDDYEMVPEIDPATGEAPIYFDFETQE